MIKTALGMCRLGAVGDTLKALDKLIGPESPIVLSPAEQYELTSVNALWMSDDYKAKESYIKLIRDIYYGTLNKVDYTKPEKVVDNINRWVNENTKGKIPTIISRDFIDKDSRLILTNAIYFKGKWQTMFNKEKTKEESFNGNKGTQKVQMMNAKDDYLYAEGSNYKALAVPYEGEYVDLMVILPDDINKFSMTDNLLEEASDALTVAEVSVKLPRFKMETTTKLKDTLKKMGAGLAFSDDADFSGIGDEKLKISEVIHKAFVDVNEEGTEAAAATAVGMIRCCSARTPPREKTFYCDKPFLFCIRKNGVNLFAGRYVNVP